MLPKGKKVNLEKLRDRRVAAIDTVRLLTRIESKKAPAERRDVLKEVALRCGVSRTSVHRWWHNQALAEKIGRPGRPRKLSQDQLEVIRKKLQQGHIDGIEWSTARVSDMIFATFGVRLCDSRAAATWVYLDPQHKHRRRLPA